MEKSVISNSRLSIKMVSAWYMDPALEGVVDQREPQQMTPNKPCELDVLAKLGVRYGHVDADN